MQAETPRQYVRDRSDELPGTGLSGEQVQQTARDTAAVLAHVSSDRPFTPHLEVWKVRGRVFLIVTENDPELQIITVKADPDHADALRRDHDSIVVGRYLNKRDWVSVGAGPGVTRQLIENLVQDSYDLAAEHRRGGRS